MRHAAEPHQILLMAGLPGLARSSKGKRPVSSWCAITPADHTSDAGTTAELSTSGAMNLVACHAYVHISTELHDPAPHVQRHPKKNPFLSSETRWVPFKFLAA